ERGRSRLQQLSRVVLVKSRVALTSLRADNGVEFYDKDILHIVEQTESAMHTVPGEPRASVPQMYDAGGYAPGHAHERATRAAAESDSEHPLARAIVDAAVSRGITIPSSSGFSSSPAVGVKAQVNGTLIEVGGPYLLQARGQQELSIAEQWRDEGAIILHVLADGQVISALRLADEIRPESFDAVSALHANNVHVGMITGDAQAVADAVARQLGIDRIYAGVRPEDKSAKVAELQDEDYTVAMVGDGINDAPALAQADVGIAIGAGTDVAIGSAGVILASSDPRSVLSVYQLSEATYRKMKQNL